MAGWLAPQPNPCWAACSFAWLRLSLPFPPHQKSGCSMEGMTCIRKWQQQQLSPPRRSATEPWIAVYGAGDQHNLVTHKIKCISITNRSFAIGLSGGYRRKRSAATVLGEFNAGSRISASYILFPFSTKMEAKVISPFERSLLLFHPWLDPRPTDRP